MSRLNLCKLCGSLPRIDKFKPPASDWVYLVECSSKDCDNAEFGDTRKKPLASGTLLTPIGTGTCRSDNETVIVTSFYSFDADLQRSLGFLPLFAMDFIQIQTLFSRYSTPPNA